jgi:hypothetical protein
MVKVAEQATGIYGSGRVFSKNILRVEVTGLEQLHLSLVDSPGLYHVGDRAPSDADAVLVRTLVKSYLEKNRSILLAVVAAKSDLAMQAIIKMAPEIGPKGQRTLGIITKPDLLFVGSHSEITFVKLATNENLFFKLGWHVLQNRDYDTRNTTRVERVATEKEFLKNRIWSSALPATKFGVENLQPRLSHVLLKKITDELPGLVTDVDGELSTCKERLKAFGGPRSTLGQQQGYSVRNSQTFATLMKGAVNGKEEDVFSAPQYVTPVSADVFEQLSIYYGGFRRQDGS